MDLPKRLAAKICKLPGENNCWEWIGARQPNGYGRVKWNTRSRVVHRVVWEVLVGLIPAGTELHHKCNNKKCVRPEHLEVVTRRENILQGASPTGRNARKTHCPRGHPYNKGNTRMDRRGRRRCRICEREWLHRWRAEHYVPHPRRKGVPEGQGRLF